MQSSDLAALSVRLQRASQELSVAFLVAEGALQTASSSFAGGAPPPPDFSAAVEEISRSAEKVPRLLGNAARVRGFAHALQRPNPLAVAELVREIAGYLDPGTMLAFALTRRSCYALLRDMLCRLVGLEHRGEIRAALLLARDPLGVQRMSHVRHLSLGMLSAMEALRKGLLAEFNTGLRHFECSISYPEEFPAFACLSPPGLRSLDVTFLQGAVTVHDLRPGALRVSFPTLCELAFRAESPVVFRAGLWDALEKGCPLLDEIEMDIVNLDEDGPDPISGFAKINPRLRAAVQALVTRSLDMIAELGGADTEGFSPGLVSALCGNASAHELDELFKRPFADAWTVLSGMKTLQHLRTTWFASSAFAGVKPPSLKWIDTEVLDFDGLSDVPADDKWIGVVEINADKYELGGVRVGKNAAKLLRRNQW
ncbi:hypothetical protein DFJ74DRAFT_690220 [Hyaloraphidium curvatum]|nr:hypothetical protein DFJ74DRAFT_690220 [Hyaloraphidium curvatum]